MDTEVFDQVVDQNGTLIGSWSKRTHMVWAWKRLRDGSEPTAANIFLWQRQKEALR